jgi:hypothetical protein
MRPPRRSGAARRRASRSDAIPPACRVRRLGGGVRPFGRPGRRAAHGGVAFWAAAVALLAACSAALRPPGATRLGHERRAWTRTSARGKQAHPGTGVPSRRAQHRSRPGVLLPAVVTTTSSPTRRETSADRYPWGRKHTHNSGAHGLTVAQKRCTVRSRPPGPAPRDRPTSVTRPVLTTIARARRWPWRRVVLGTVGCRPCKHAQMSIEGFLWGWRWRCGRPHL